MSQTPARDVSTPVSVALCLSEDAISRFGVIIRHLVVGQVDQPVRLTVLSSDPRVTSLSLGPVQVVQHPRIGRLFARRRLQYLLESLAPHPPSIIHAFSGESYDLAAQLAEILDAELVLQVSSLHDVDELENASTVPRKAIIASSEPLMDLIAARHHAPMDAIQLIKPGVIAAPSPAAFAQSDRDPTAICTASLLPDHGVDQLLQAAAILQNKGLSLLIFLLGTGRLESELRRQAARLGLSRSVTFAPSETNPIHAFQGADIFVQPAPSTSLNADSFLAMSLGMTVVACRDSISDHLLHDQTAVVCESSAPEVLAMALESILKNQTQAGTLGAKALEYIRKHHLVSNMVDKNSSFIRTISMSHNPIPISNSPSR